MDLVQQTDSLYFTYPNGVESPEPERACSRDERLFRDTTHKETSAHVRIDGDSNDLKTLLASMGGRGSGALCSPNLIPGADAPGYMLSPLSGLVSTKSVIQSLVISDA